MARPDYCPVGGEPCQSLCETPCSTTGETKKLRAALVAAEKAIQEAAADMVGYCGKDPEQLAEPLRRAADARVAIRAALTPNDSVSREPPRSGGESAGCTG